MQQKHSLSLDQWTKLVIIQKGKKLLTPRGTSSIHRKKHQDNQLQYLAIKTDIEEKSESTSIHSLNCANRQKYTSQISHTGVNINQTSLIYLMTNKK